MNFGQMFDIGSSAVSIWNAEKNRDLQYDTVSRNLADNQVNRDFQERMSNTAYQRMVQDLNTAGLSPMLAYSKGSASTPSGNAGGGSASGSAIEAPKFGETAVRNAQVAVAKSQELLNQSNAQKAVAETRNINADTVNKNEMFEQIGTRTGEMSANIPQIQGLTALHGQTAKQIDALIDRIRQEIAIEKPKERFSTEEPDKAKWLHPLRDALSTIFGGVGLLRGSSAMPFVTQQAPKGKK
jgi:hypothetical protein